MKSHPSTARMGATSAQASDASAASDSAQPLVRIRNLQVRFVGAGAPVQAVSGVDLDVTRGEVVALIGESGSGKSVTLRTVMALHTPARPRRRSAPADCGS